jgi:hypothetical protein
MVYSISSRYVRHHKGGHRMGTNYGGMFRQTRKRMKVSIQDAAKLIGLDMETIRDHEYGKVATTKSDYEAWVAALKSDGRVVG